MAILIGILLPAMSKAQRSAKHTACRAALHDIGASFQMYLNESKARLPWVNAAPSVRPAITDAPSLPALLEGYARGASRRYRCSEDRITKPSPGSPSGFQTYFEREGSSYQYNPFLASFFGGFPVNDRKIQLLGSGELGRVVVISDYEAFHGLPGSGSAMNALFLDMHVGDSLESMP